jgi:hypothetical protein
MSDDYNFFKDESIDPRIRAFVQGVRWWIWASTGFTAFKSELDLAYEEAKRIFTSQDNPFRTDYDSTF